MSQQERVSEVPQTARTERWFIVMAASFAPVVVAFLAPQSFKIPLLASAGALVLAGLVMLLARGRLVDDNEVEK